MCRLAAGARFVRSRRCFPLVPSVPSALLLLPDRLDLSAPPLQPIPRARSDRLDPSCLLVQWALLARSPRLCRSDQLDLLGPLHRLRPPAPSVLSVPVARLAPPCPQYPVAPSAPLDLPALLGRWAL